MKHTGILWCVASGFLLLSGCEKAEFREFASTEGRFKVLMPGKPAETVQMAAGTSMKVYTVEEWSGAYTVAFADMPILTNESYSQTQTRLDGARDGMVRNINAKLTSSTSINLKGGHPGREVLAELPNQNGILRARMYLVGKRFYQIVVIGKKPWAESKDATRFLDSLVVTP